MTKKTKVKEWYPSYHYEARRTLILEMSLNASISLGSDLHHFLKGTYRYNDFLEDTSLHVTLRNGNIRFFNRVIQELKKLYGVTSENSPHGTEKVSSEFIRILNQANANNETFLSCLFHYCTEPDGIFGLQTEVLSVLQGAGIKVEWLKPSVELRNHLQQTLAMSVALKSNALRCFKQYLQLKLLLDSEKMGLQKIFDVVLAETDRHGATLLHYAAVGKDETLLDYILPRYEKNKAMNCKTSSGDTALHWAVLNNKAHAVRKLMKAGLDADIPNRKGETPRQLALYYSDRVTLEALLEGTKEFSEKTAAGRKTFFDALETEPSQREHIQRIQQLVAPVVDGFAIIDSDFTSFIINLKSELDYHSFSGKSKPMRVLKQLYDGQKIGPLPLSDLIVLEKVLREAIARVMGGINPEWIQDEYYLKIYRLDGFYSNFETDLISCEDLPQKLKDLRKLWYKYVVFQGQPPLAFVDDAGGNVETVLESASVRMENLDAIRFCDLTAHPLYAEFEEDERALIRSVAKLNPLLPLYTHTLLNYAININSTVAMRLIIEQCRHWRARDWDGKPPLFTAILNGRWDLVDLLMEFSRKIEVDDTGYTQLHYIVRQDSPEGHRYLSLLLSKFLYAINQKSQDGHTPLHVATMFGNTGAVRILVEAGANIEARTRNGDTPLSLAVGIVRRDGSHKTLSDFLVANGASTAVVNHNGFSPNDREKYWKSLLGFNHFVEDRKDELFYVGFYFYKPYCETIRPRPTKSSRLFHKTFDSARFEAEISQDLKLKNYRYLSLSVKTSELFAFYNQQYLAINIMKGEPSAKTLEEAYQVLPATRARILDARTKVITYIIENSIEYKLQKERDKHTPKPLQKEKEQKKFKKKKDKSKVKAKFSLQTPSLLSATPLATPQPLVFDNLSPASLPSLPSLAFSSTASQTVAHLPLSSILCERKQAEEERTARTLNPPEAGSTPVWIVNKLQGGRGRTYIRSASFYLRNLMGIESFESNFASEWGFFEDLLSKHLCLTAKQYCLITIIENLSKEHRNKPAFSVLSQETFKKLTDLREFLVKSNYLFYAEVEEQTDNGCLDQILPLFKSLFPIVAKLERTFLLEEMHTLRVEVNRMFETPACQKVWQDLESHYKSKQERTTAPEKTVEAILNWMKELAPFYLGCKGSNRFSGLSLLSKSHELKSILHFSLSQGITDLERILHTAPQFQSLMIRGVLQRIRPIRNMTAHGEEVSEEQMKAVLDYIEDCDWLCKAPALSPSALSVRIS